jgi:uncharacterized protein (UPF0261 family)
MTISIRDKKCIVIICNLDTRGEDIVFVKDLIRGRGHEAILVDFSMEEPPLLAGDVTCEEVALRGGLPIETVRQYYRSNREAATNNQIAGVAAIVADLVKQGQVHGVIGIGGATSTLVSTSNRIYVGSLEMFVAMNAAVTRTALAPVIDRVFPFEGARDAYSHLASGAHFGKVVVTV